MTNDEIVAALDALPGGDSESAHADADDLLLQAVAPEVRDAWLRTRERVTFWYA